MQKKKTKQKAKEIKTYKVVVSYQDVAFLYEDKEER